MSVQILRPAIGKTTRSSSFVHCPHAKLTFIQVCMLVQECMECGKVGAGRYWHRGAQQLCNKCHNKAKSTAFALSHHHRVSAGHRVSTRSSGRRPHFQGQIDDLGACIYEQVIDERLKLVLSQRFNLAGGAPSAKASLEAWVTWLKKLLDTVNVKGYPTWLLPSKLKKIRSLTDRLDWVRDQV